MKWIIVIIALCIVKIDCASFDEEKSLTSNRIQLPKPEEINLTSLGTGGETEFVPGLVVKQGENGPVFKISDSTMNLQRLALTRNKVTSQQTGSILTGTAIANLEPLCGSLFGFFCYDCRTRVFCNNDPAPFFAMSCPPSMPYCANDVCSTTPDERDPTCTATNFFCTSAGYFPDPFDCTKYYYCSATSATPIATYDCPSGLVYNTRTRSCQRTPSLCKPIDCSNRAGQFVLYKPNPGYYAFCTVPGTINYPVLMFRCSDSDNSEFNLSTMTCEYNCRREGVFADTVNANMYWFCYKEAGRLRSRHDTCPDTLVFRDGQCREPLT